MRKAKVIKPFRHSSCDYKYGDELFIIKSNIGENIELVLTKDRKDTICEINSIFFQNKLEIVEREPLYTEEVTSEKNKINIEEMTVEELLQYFKESVGIMEQENNSHRKSLLSDNLNIIQHELLIRMNEI